MIAPLIMLDSIILAGGYALGITGQRRWASRFALVVFVGSALTLFVYYLPIWLGTPITRDGYYARMWLQGPPAWRDWI
jgi:dolichyl-phosphate-mannose--protein O-mannosyl transferase